MDFSYWHALGILLPVLLVLGVAWVSIQRRERTGGRAKGLGGPNDPIAGAVEMPRDPEEMRESLNTAAALRRDPDKGVQVHSTER